MARCYANENFPLPVVKALRKMGHDVLTSRDAGQAGEAIPDEEVLRFACTQDRILLTFNRKDFIRLHRAATSHAGIVVCRFDPEFPTLAQRIHRVLAEPVAWAGRLAKVNRPTESP